MDERNQSNLPPPPPDADNMGGDPPPPADSGLAANADSGEPRWFNQSVAGVPAWGVLAAAVLIWVIVVAIALRGSEESSSADLTFSVTTPTAASAAVTATIAVTDSTIAALETVPDVAASSTTTTIGPSQMPSTAPPTSAAVIDTATTIATTVATTTAPATTTTTTTTTSTTTPTTVPPAAPTIVISEPVTATGPNGERLTVTPRRSECRYGSECFVASFRIEGFARQPQEFVCEFSSGARYVFRFSSAGADPACSTLDIPDSIVVEVGGLRTEPVFIRTQ